MAIMEGICDERGVAGLAEEPSARRRELVEGDWLWMESFSPSYRGVDEFDKRGAVSEDSSSADSDGGPVALDLPLSFFCLEEEAGGDGERSVPECDILHLVLRGLVRLMSDVAMVF